MFSQITETTSNKETICFSIYIDSQVVEMEMFFKDEYINYILFFLRIMKAKYQTKLSENQY